jgi:hypothetical protein
VVLADNFSEGVPNSRKKVLVCRDDRAIEIELDDAL